MAKIIFDYQYTTFFLKSIPRHIRKKSGIGEKFGISNLFLSQQAEVISCYRTLNKAIVACTSN